MSTTAHTYLPRDSHQPRGGRRPWCATCNTDRHLLVESVTTLNERQKTLAAAVTCTKCGASRVMATTAAFVKAVPGRNEDNKDVVHRDAEYVHCQEPMCRVDPELRGVHWPVSTEAGPPEFLSVYLKTRVLRCRCGFQIEIPHQ
jgi:hypothetical protein